jgi:hypothetical protein
MDRVRLVGGAARPGERQAAGTRPREGPAQQRPLRDEPGQEQLGRDLPARERPARRRPAFRLDRVVAASDTEQVP